MTTFVNADGTVTQDLSSTPVRVKQADGSWSATDLTLRQNSDGSIGPAVSPVDVSLGGAGSRTVATLAVGSGSVSYGWSSALPTPSLSGSTATYAGVRPGVDLVVTVTTSGVETSVVFHSAAAASTGPVDLAVTASGLTASQSASGVVSYADSSGTAVAQTPTPQAWDAELGGDLLGPGAGPVATVSSAMTTSSGQVLAPAASSGTVTSATGVMTDQLQVPSTLLNDSSTVYPLVLDPGVDCTTCGEGVHGYVENDGDTEMDSSFDNGYVHVGTFDGGVTVTRGLYAFSQGSTHGQHLISAQLNLTNVYSWSCTARTVTVWNSDPVTTGSTWANSGIGSLSDTPAGFAYGYSSSCPAKSVGFPVSNIVSGDMASSTTSAFYFQLRTNESDSTYWKKFSPTATLAVNYATYPGWPAGRSVTPCWAQCSGWIDTWSRQPALTGATTTADGENLNYTFEVYTSNSSWALGSLAASLSVNGVKNGALATTTSSVWGTQTLSSGVHYYLYRVRACDASITSVCGAWSSDAHGWVEFEVDTGTPAAPSVVVPASATFDSPMTATFSPGAGGTGGTIYGYAYSWSDTPPTYGQSTAVPACASNSNGIWFACANGSGDATSASIGAAGGTTSTLYAWAFTLAGVMSPTATNPVHTTDGSIGNGHSWLTETDTTPGTCQAGPVTDSQSTNGSNLTLPGSGVCWEQATDTGAPMVTDPNTGLPVTAGALDFTSTTPVAATTGTHLSTVSAYTVAAWVDVPNSALTDGGYHTVMSESGSDHSAFYLQLAPVGTAVQWRFCLQNQTGTVGTHCAYTTDPAGVQAGSWYYLAGEWDPANLELRLYVNGTAVMATPYTPPAGEISASGDITVGDATGGGAPSNAWLGQVIDPVAIPSDATANQISELSTGMMSPSQVG